MSELVSGMLRRKYLILGAMLAGAVLAYLLVSQVEPRFTSRASIMLDPRTIEVLSDDQVVSAAELNDPFLESEVAVLKSGLLLEQVVASFPPERLERFDPANRPLSTLASLRSGITVGLERGLDALGIKTTRAQRETFLLSPEERRIRRLVSALRASMLAYREGRSYLISISVETRDPELSMLFANQIAQTYIDQQIERRIETVRGARNYLMDRVDRVRAQVEQAERRFEDFRSEQLAISGVSAAALESQRNELSSQLSIAKADLASATARFGQIESVIAERGMTAAAELLSSPFILSLRQKLFENERQDADYATRYGPDHPDRQSLRASSERIVSELEKEVRQIIAQLRNEATVARIRLDVIREGLSELEARASEVARASLQLRQLEREADAVRVNYQALLQRLNEARALEDLQQADARFVETAGVAMSPSAPRTMLFTAFGGALGLAGGLMLALFSTVSIPGFTRPSQLEWATGFPLLAAVPKVRWRDAAEQLGALRAKPYQVYLERLRRLRGGLQLQARDGKLQTILVTSAIADEGKTTTALGLAYIESLSGKSCILVDFDLRRATLGRTLSCGPAKGDLAQYLRHKCRLEEAIAGVAEGGFDLLSARAPAPNVVDTITAAHLRALICDLERLYDVVIIDSPPLLNVPEGVQLADCVDAVVLVVRYGVTTQRTVTEAARILLQTDPKVRGVLFSMVDTSKRDNELGLGEQGD